ncbi:MAG TPA: hypothetical protein VI299_07320 [Polyangiales bacterium]
MFRPPLVPPGGTGVRPLAGVLAGGRGGTERMSGGAPEMLDSANERLGAPLPGIEGLRRGGVDDELLGTELRVRGRALDDTGWLPVLEGGRAAGIPTPDVGRAGAIPEIEGARAPTL